MMKRCYKCKEEKQIEAFSRNQAECKACAKAYRASYYKKNKEILTAYQSSYRLRYPEKCSSAKKAWYKENKESASFKRKTYYKANKEKINNQQKIWQKENLDKFAAAKAKRKAKKLQATPKWMTAADFAAIQEWYQIAKELQWLSEEKLHVDHIIPLQGKDVCGLHIAANLQILPASENISKGNRIADAVVKYNKTGFLREVKEGVS